MILKIVTIIIQSTALYFAYLATKNNYNLKTWYYFMPAFFIICLQDIIYLGIDHKQNMILNMLNTMVYPLIIAICLLIGTYHAYERSEDKQKNNFNYLKTLDKQIQNKKIKKSIKKGR